MGEAYPANDDQRLELNGLLEPDYYASQTNSGGPIKVVGWIVALVWAICDTPRYRYAYYPPYPPYPRPPYNVR